MLIKGQDGVGKTALAEHLVQRLIAAEPKNQPFVLENLESFQVKPGEGFADEYANIQELLNFLCDDAAGQFHVVLNFEQSLNPN